MRQHEAARRNELAEFLRSRRQDIQPEDVGIKRQGRRRVKGLRRHEVADLAAVSLTWYTWLEQGRPIRTSPEVLDSLARALRLDEDERQYLRRLGGASVEPKSEVTVPADALVGIMDDLLPCPAYLINAANDLAGWNVAYSTLFDDPNSYGGNALRMMVGSPTVRSRIVDWEAEMIEELAAFRAEAAKFPADDRISSLVEELTNENEAFRAAWQGYTVRRFQLHVQRVEHERVGLISTEILQFRPLGQASLILRVHRPSDLTSRERLERLIADAD